MVDRMDLVAGVDEEVLEMAVRVERPDVENRDFVNLMNRNPVAVGSAQRPREDLIVIPRMSAARDEFLERAARKRSVSLRDEKTARQLCDGCERNPRKMVPIENVGRPFSLIAGSRSDLNPVEERL